MDILLVHQSYPGQFVHLAEALASRGDRLTAICRSPGRKTVGARGGNHARLVSYTPDRGNTKGMPPQLRETETKVLRGLWVAQEAKKLREEGYYPDLILAYTGWGEALFLKDVWPECPQLHYLEFDYSQKTDCGFDPEFSESTTVEEAIRQRMKTINSLLNFQCMDWGYTPTHFQWQTLPEAYRSRVSVIHDGIDTELLRPSSTAALTLADGTTLRSGDPVLTFVNRTFEPYRGIHRLMRALPELQQRLPDLQVLLIGLDSARVSYGKSRSDGRGWLSVLREELEGHLDWSRIHTPGALSYQAFIQAMQISAVHVYFTYPFVLSWSLLEAMACGAMVIGSATDPVKEVVQDGKNGLLVGFHDQDGLIQAVSDIIQNPDQYKALRREARRTIKKNYQKELCISRQLALIDAIALRSIMPNAPMAL